MCDDELYTLCENLPTLSSIIVCICDDEHYTLCENLPTLSSIIVCMCDDELFTLCENLPTPTLGGLGQSSSVELARD